MTTEAALADVRQLLGSTTLRDYLSSRPPSTIVVLRTDWSLEKSLQVRISTGRARALFSTSFDAAEGLGRVRPRWTTTSARARLFV